MARVRLCVCGSWFVGREGQAAHPRAPGQCLHFECRGAPARVRVWRCEGRPPLPHHLCVWRNLPLTLPYMDMGHGVWGWTCGGDRGDGGGGDGGGGDGGGGGPRSETELGEGDGAAASQWSNAHKAAKNWAATTRPERIEGLHGRPIIALQGIFLHHLPVRLHKPTDLDAPLATLGSSGAGCGWGRGLCCQALRPSSGSSTWSRASARSPSARKHARPPPSPGRS